MNTRQVLEQAVAGGRLRPLDLHFALRLQRLAGTQERPALLIAAALVSHALGQGHVCLDLHNMTPGCDGIFAPEQLDILSPELESLCAPVVGPPGAGLPLVLDKQGRFYLARYYAFEQELAASLRARAGRWADTVDRALLRDGLRRLFPLASRDEIDWQKLAAALALLRPFCVISGGPGTGKTRTVTAILVLLLEQTPNLRIALAAPTGKAAARLAEAVRLARSELAISTECATMLPETASTVHRLLGFRPDRVEPRHDAANPLPYDLVVVDEASMVDLPLMARLLAALRPDTRLILLGDRDQLASVEAGRVLGDICGTEAETVYSDEQCRLLTELAGAELPHAVRPAIADHVAVLRKSYRFGDDSGIGRAAKAVNTADMDALLAVLRPGASADVALETVDRQMLPAVLRRWFLPRMASCLGQTDQLRQLQSFATFRMLGAVHDGDFGVRRLNSMCGELLRREGLLDVRQGEHYHGRPILVQGNDQQLGLFNGDIGIIRLNEDGRPLVWFEAGAAPRALAPSRLPAHDTVYAMTVHKSQGSEFDDVLLVLPEGENRALSRELLYTAVTRARRSLTIVARPEALAQALHNRSRRTSGLYDALWK